MTRRIGVLAVSMTAAFAGACGGGNGQNMMNSGMNGSGGTSAGTAFMSMSPAGGATGVAANSPITFRFSGAMGAGMEQYMDLHVGDLSGPEVPMSCAWSGDRTQATCTPTSPLAARTMYTIHLGGGMTSASGVAVDCTPGLGMGGQWVMGGMMTGNHGGMAWGMMGNGWRNANGSYGMMFSFTTA
jgi:hypothetical protein